MANEWYYAKDGQQQGPVSAKELKRLADAGQLGAGDLVWKEGMPDWKPAADVKGLVAAAAPPAGEAVVTQPASSTPRRGRSRHRSPIGQVLLIIAGVLLIGQMCVPWWSMVIKDTDDSSTGSGSNNGAKRRAAVSPNGPLLAFQNRGRFSRSGTTSRSRSSGDAMMIRMIAHGSNREFESVIESLEKALSSGAIPDSKKDSVQKALKFFKIAKKDRKWWNEHLKSGDKTLEDRMKDVIDDDIAVFRIWGWNEGAGIMGLVFGVVVMVGSIIFISIPPLRNWSWIVSILAAIFGIIILIFALIWIFSAPGQDASPEFRQGIIVGPYLLLAGGVMFLLVGIFDMIAGLSFLSRLRRLKAQA